MFWTAELLSRRDSGFGLAWLAATLGPKSSFRKLPKRSVLAADIAALCNLIAQPAEPLALRLSSNLMIGVARIYKVKQEILLTDITSCYHTLKKAVQDIHAATSAAAQLQMGQPHVRPETVTAVADPTVAFALDFDHLFGGWGESSTQTLRREQSDGSDDEYDPTKSKSKKPRSKARSASVAEQPRAGAHTLQEDHTHLFSNSFDASFNDLGGLASSSQAGGFHFDDNFLDGLDLTGDIGDELARELGEGWGVSTFGENEVIGLGNAPDIEMTGLPDFGGDFRFDEAGGQLEPGMQVAPGSPGFHSSPRTGLGVHASDGSIVVPLAPLSPLLHPDEHPPEEGSLPTARKGKRVRLLLDSRTELTNEELERARTHYMDEQTELRRAMERRKLEKEGGRLIEEMLWGVPRGFDAPVLVDFWTESFRVQVEARQGRLHMHTEGEPPRKRRKTGGDEQAATEQDMGMNWDLPAPDVNMEADLPPAGQDYDEYQREIDFDSRMRSSEEPGQARRVSRQPSVFGSQFDLGIGGAPEGSGSQKNNLFPWDHAGISSSVSGVVFRAAGSDRPSFGRADSRLRGSSLARDSLGPLVPESPASFGLTASHRGEGYEFELPAEDPLAAESQLSDASVMTLERNSFNFLEYAKMQLNAFPSATSSIKFNDVVPQETSTRHVAAAAFYHCLVLTTKDLLGVRQAEPYGEIEIVLK